jgi:AraC family transcriptional regulator, alkane utilization regulator
MDALSDVLQSIRLEGAVYLEAIFTAPWCVLGHYGLERARQRLPHAEHLFYFHCLTEGSCKVRLRSGSDTIELVAGDVVLFPQDDQHLLGSDLHLAPLDGAVALGAAATATPDFFRMREGGGGAVTRFVCGYLACSRGVGRPLFEALPRMVRVPLGEGPAAALVHELLREAVRESLAPASGAASMLARLAELMFMHAMRRYAENLPHEGKGWLAGLRDAHVGRALRLMHREPARDWTVDELARGAALSRSALAERFASLVGEPPMQYLTRWRLALAAQALRSGAEAIARVAERSGYDSEAAFSRAFKREFGKPPATWRRSVAQ